MRAPTPARRACPRAAAATMRGLITPPRGVVEVTAETNRRGDERLRVHWAPLRGETEVVRGLRATTLARAFLDLAAVRYPIARPVHEATASGLASLADLRVHADAASGRRGVVALRRALGMPHTRSKLEDSFVLRVRERGLPEPSTNHKLFGFSVDAYFEEPGWVIELDHERTHGTAVAIAQDAERDAALAARGLPVRRVREWQWPALLDEIAAAYAHASPLSSSRRQR